MLWIGEVYIWLTNFTLQKCKVLSFGIQVNRKNMAIFYVMYTDEDHQLDGIEENDLDLLLNSFVKFGNHI